MGVFFTKFSLSLFKSTASKRQNLSYFIVMMQKIKKGWIKNKIFT